VLIAVDSDATNASNSEAETVPSADGGVVPTKETLKASASYAAVKLVI
jgi:hypothetical protein